MSVPIRRLVLDVLKPHDPDIVSFARGLASESTADAVDAVLVETDREVETVTVTIRGSALDVAGLESTIRDLGGSVHSIDRVVCADGVADGLDGSEDGFDSATDEFGGAENGPDTVKTRSSEHQSDAR